VAAGCHQSLSRTADDLGVNHSAISRHVNGLEPPSSLLVLTDMRPILLSHAGSLDIVSDLLSEGRIFPFASPDF
jgi:DNA-binding transcriptional LysR family regulator